MEGTQLMDRLDAQPESFEIDVPDMTFSSSPVLYPQSSSPVPPPKSKRKLFKTFSPEEPAFKKPKTVSTTITVVDSNNEEIPGNVVGHSNREIHNEDVNVATLQQFEVEGLSNVALVPDEVVTPNLPQPINSSSPCLAGKDFELQTCSGKKLKIGLRRKQNAETYEQLIAQRSVTAPGRAKKEYYGVEIHKLMDEANVQKQLDKAAEEFREQQAPIPSVEQPSTKDGVNDSKLHQMWTEKYRAKKFTELVGDERTHRSVLKWLKSWDSIVFPGNVKAKPKRIYEDHDAEQERQQRKILLLTGPPGLGKTTLAHVCAKQAGYEVLEINASDDRSRDVVKGRIKDALGTENVRGIQEAGKSRKAGRPVCVVVDEVDGVVTGSAGSGGEGGFVKALIDLVQLDQKNSSQPTSSATANNGKKKGDKFRLMRPMVLICNDVYAPSLRPLRTSSVAEVVHVRKPPIDKVIARMKTVFEKEKIPCDGDAVRRLCESSWGLGTRKQNSVASRGAGEGDIRGVLVQGEWIAHKLRSTATDETRLTRKWIEGHLGSLQSTSAQKGLGRGGVREVVERLFVEGAGLPNLPTVLAADEARLIAESKQKPVGVADLRKRTAINALREMIDSCGEHDRLMTDCFATYPTQIFQDDTFLSKPNSSYEWLHFHDSLSRRVFSGQEWELNPYLSTSACAFHDLFSAVDKGASGWNENEKQDFEEAAEAHPYSGLKADFAAHEAEKQNKAMLTEMQAAFSSPMLRLFSSVDAIATELMPNVSRMMAPDVKPVVVGGSGGGPSVASVRKESERNCVQYSVRAMTALGIEFEKVRVEHEGLSVHSSGGFALRMEPPIDSLSSFHFGKTSSTYTPTAPVRYAVRQVLDQELRKEKILQSTLTRQARVTKAVNASVQNPEDRDADDNKENIPIGVSTASDLDVPKPVRVMKRDFFGRPIERVDNPLTNSNGKLDAEAIAKSTARKGKAGSDEIGGKEARTWVSFHEGFSNAVRKPITLAELVGSF